MITLHREKIKDLTIVITGASSGIGKAIALSLAHEGARLILASRREAILQAVASECEAKGGEAIAVACDVTKFEDVQSLMQKALDTYGQIDVWINNAGVLAAGEFTETPLEVHEQVININLLGPLYGMYTVLPYFQERGRGQIINTVSLGAYVPNPYSAAYDASKFGLRGLSDALRYENLRFKDVHICDVNPAFIDTPGINHAANFTGAELVPVPPLYDPFQVADAVLSLIERPRDKVMVGGTARLGRTAQVFFPKLIGAFMDKVARKYFERGKKSRNTEGNLFEPEMYIDHEARGERMKRPSLLKRYFNRKYALD